MSEETIGQTLQQARQQRGLSLEQMEAETHIRQRYLQALESGDLSGLPSIVQGRGFLRLYAEALGLEAAPLLAGFGAPPPAAQGAAQQPASNETPAPAAPEALPLPPPSPAPVQPAPPAETSTRTRSQLVFAEIGRSLRAQRELLSLPLEDVEDYIHVRSRYLAALEDGRMDDLPSPVQGRGMLANYAHFLNLDAEAILLRFAEALQARREELAPQPTPAARRQPAVVVSHPALRRFLSFDLLLAGGVILLLVGFVIWGSSQVMSQRGDNRPAPTAPNISEVLLGATPFGGTPQATRSTEPAGGPAATPSPASGDTNPTEALPTLAITLPAGAGGTVQVSIVANQRVWMEITADGKVAFSGRTTPGGSYQFSGEQQVELLTGNAAGLQVVYNQGDLGVLGSLGQVIDVIFTPEGMQSPTAMPSPTSAASPTPTGNAPAPTSVKPTP